MRKSLGLAFCFLFLFASVSRAQNARKDERKIRALAARWQKDWNHNDAKALAGLLSVNGDYVTGRGTWLRGRDAFENWRADLPPAAIENGAWNNTRLSFRFLQADVAVVHLTWTVSAGRAAMVAPVRPRTGISTWLVVKIGSRWQIRAVQDTRVRKPAP